MIRLWNLWLPTLAWLGLVGLHTWYASGMTGPLILDDEFGYLTVAAFLAGLDWSPLTSGMVNYDFGFSLLLVPLFWLFTDPGWIYQGALFMNALLASSVLLLSRRIAVELFPDARRSTVLMASLTTSVYTSYLVYSNLAWAETLLVAGYWLTVALSIYIPKTKNQTAVHCLFGVFVGFLYLVHARSICALVGGSLLVIVVFWLGDSSRKKMLCYLVSVLLVLAAGHLLTSYLHRELWGGSVYFRGVSGQLMSLASMEGLASLATKLAGQVFYMGIATALLAYVGFAWAMGRLWSSLCQKLSSVRRREEDPGHKLSSNPRNAPLLYTVTTSLCMLTLSCLFLAPAARVDAIFYGRYNEAFLGPFILFGLLGVLGCMQARKSKFVVLIRAALLLCFLAVILWSLVGEFLASGPIANTNITSLFPIKLDNWRVDLWRALLLGLAGSSCIWLASWRSLKLGIALIGSFFLFAGHVNVTGQLYAGVETVVRDRDVAAWLNGSEEGTKVLFLKSEIEQKNLQAKRFQFWLPRMIIIPIESLEGSQQRKADYLLTTTELEKIVQVRFGLIYKESSDRFILWKLRVSQ